MLLCHKRKKAVGFSYDRYLCLLTVHNLEGPNEKCVGAPSGAAHENLTLKHA